LETYTSSERRYEEVVTVLHPRYRNEEFARRGDEIYERDIRPRLAPENEGKFIVIDR
jgi:hypothetical protein